MDRRSLLEVARVARELTQEAVARRSGTSQPTLSAYERGTKSPTLAVAERILHSLGFDLGLQPRVTFREVHGERGGTYLVPDQLWRVDPPACFAPIDVRGADRTLLTSDVLNRKGRVEAYAWLLTHGDEEQLFNHLDGALLVDAWVDLAPRLPAELRTEWQPLVLDAGMGWLAEERARWQERHGKPVSRGARERLIRGLASRGLTADEIRRLL
ncbi:MULTISPECIES: helix-turn-helix transcriptional regulator [unclassified Nocardioides]|uniref:helix-turn-helix transcriptional regulator n=1 Tax=unclassified Nocardioides TaxID=2615069 RepID=UPI0009F0795A|nr:MULTISPECIES: helix-turn-helix transcriptional regulator [unclassified Nocardioides]GAW49417.1 Transcriptional regulator, XRE family [Nocardioides sp. PD653-B2]GAW55069.1 Transcriptional regulator, XRE family [Nocardioides sp. PD653]